MTLIRSPQSFPFCWAYIKILKLSKANVSELNRIWGGTLSTFPARFRPVSHLFDTWPQINKWFLTCRHIFKLRKKQGWKKFKSGLIHLSWSSLESWYYPFSRRMITGWQGMLLFATWKIGSPRTHNCILIAYEAQAEVGNKGFITDNNLKILAIQCMLAINPPVQNRFCRWWPRSSFRY